LSSFNLFLADSEAGFKDADEGDQLQGACSRDGIKGSKATLDGGEGNSRGDVYGERRFKNYKHKLYRIGIYHHRGF